MIARRAPSMVNLEAGYLRCAAPGWRDPTLQPLLRKRPTPICAWAWHAAPLPGRRWRVEQPPIEVLLASDRGAVDLVAGRIGIEA